MAPDGPLGPQDGPARPPRWAAVARALREGIAAGRHPVGSVLPAELELAAAHGVSRDTVRRALAALAGEGLVRSRRGVGARVAAEPGAAPATFALGSLEEIERFARAAVFHVEDAEMVRAEGALADALGCRAGRRWLRLRGVRRAEGDPRPLCLTEAHIDARYAEGLSEPRAHAVSVVSTIERLHGDSVVEARQSFAAALIDAEAARRLGAKEGAPALRVSRRYFGAGGRLIEAASNLHPADRFVYEMTLRRTPGAGGEAP